MPNTSRSSQSGNACLADAGGAPLTEEMTLGQRLVPSRLVGRGQEPPQVSMHRQVQNRLAGPLMRGRGTLTVALPQPSGAKRRNKTPAPRVGTGLCSEKQSMVCAGTRICKWTEFSRTEGEPRARPFHPQIYCSYSCLPSAFRSAPVLPLRPSRRWYSSSSRSWCRSDSSSRS
jgi:hypothetical protein